ncbi:MAG: alpha/beta hydrolase [Cyanobacteria bacterium P01_A01_bin.3]
MRHLPDGLLNAIGLTNIGDIAVNGRWWLAGTVGLVAAVAGVASQAIAAEDLVFLASGGSRTVPVEDLITFAETGEMSRQLDIYINDYLDAESAEQYRNGLNFEVQLNFAEYAGFLQSDSGQCVLNVMARVVKPTPTNDTAVQSVRAGLINGAAPDGRLSLLDLIQSYPNSKLHIDTNEIRGSSTILQDAWTDLRASLEQAGVPVAEDAFVTQESLDLIDVDYDILETAAADLFCERLAESSPAE